MVDPVAPGAAGDPSRSTVPAAEPTMGRTTPPAAAPPAPSPATPPPAATPPAGSSTPVPPTTVAPSAEPATDLSAPLASPPSVAPPAPATLEQAVADAYAAGAPQLSRLAIAVLDLRTRAFSGAGDIDEPYASASVVKVLIAARLLADGRAEDPGVRDLMWKMITVSDDDAGSQLYRLAGSETLVGWVSAHYGIDGLAPATQPGYWGLTRITARAMVYFYAVVAGDPAVGPWLLDAMAHARPYGSDGFPQHFGLPSAAATWRVKQGWMCCLDGVTRMHSTGYVDGDGYAVALLTEGDRSLYNGAGAQVLTTVAQTLLPGGVVPVGASG